MSTRLDLTPEGVQIAHRLPGALYDSWLLQAAMIAHGLPTARLPKNALLSDGERPGDRLAFIDGEALGTSFAAESISQHVASWHALLRRNRIPIARGATFRTNQPRTATRYAKDLEFPVSLRLLDGTRRENATAIATDTRQLRGSLATFRKRDATSRVLVEPIANKVLLDCLVLGDEVHSVVQSSAAIQDASESDGATEVGRNTHPDLKQLAVDALQSIPGLNQGSVRLLAGNASSALGRQEATVVDIVAAPLLRARTGLSGNTGLVRDCLQYHVEQAGGVLSSRQDLVDSSLIISGLVEASGLVDEIRSVLRDLELTIPEDLIDTSEEEQIRLRVSGSPEATALLTVITVNGTNRGQRAHSATTNPSESTG